jgi:SNF2 family DNA or RNA helicase
MQITIVRGRIRISFPPEIDDVGLEKLQERLASDIGSARVVENHSELVSCALSVNNFRKLKRIGAGLADDRHTREVVKRLREKLDLYEEETRRADRVKDGLEVYQNYEFKLPPFEHQKLGFQFLHAVPTPALFGDCGTGKTFIVLTFADSLLKAGEDWAFIVVCPVNLIKHVWVEDAGKFSDLQVVGLRESTQVSILASDFDDKKDSKTLNRNERAALRAERRLDDAWKKKAKRKAQARYRKKLDARFDQEADMFVINPENLRTDTKERRVRDLCKRLKKAGKEVCLILDESSKIKSRTSRTYKAIKRIRSHCSRCIIMTGTPSPNGILDLWAQFDILDGGMTLQPNFVDFRHDNCNEVVLRGVTWEKDGKTYNATKWHPRAGAARDVYQTLKPRMIRFKLEDCIDLPPVRFIMRDVEMSTDQEAFYRDMEERLFAELEGEPVTAKVAVSKLIKLREVTGGFVRTDEGKDIPFNKDATKMLELDELLEQSIGDKLGDDGPPLKAIVWAQYRWECKTLIERYRRKYGARGLFGGISSGAKDESIARFRSDPNCRILVCHPQSAGHGLTLTEANYAFYYSLSYNFEEFYQSFRRITRPGQKRAMTFYFLVAPGTIDEELIDAIRTKKNLSDMVTDGQFSRTEFLGERGTNGGQLQLGWDLPETDDPPPLQ